MTHFSPSTKLTRQAKHRRAVATESADCGPIDVSTRDVERWESCRFDLLKFLVEYFPATTGLRPFSDDHKRVIARIQSCILSGGRFANVCYRGFAKTTITENASIWGALYGHRKFLAIFSANNSAAKGIIRSIKRELAENDLLAQDFPHICQPIAALEGKAQRCASQTCDGAPTHVEWTAERIVLPNVPGSEGAGGAISCFGLMSGTLGLKVKRADGTQQRPDFVILDDPQTRESAIQPAQVNKRMDVLLGGILKMAGHRTQIAAVCNGTVIAADDMMDRLLDHKKSSAWQSERIPMVRSWSTAHETLWLDQYAEIRRNFDPEQPGDQLRAHRAANDFYLANRDAMDAGCSVSWDWCYAEDTGDPNSVPEVSAIQHAYDLLIDDGEAVFASECQCQPIKLTEQMTEAITKELVTSKITALARGTVPTDCTTLTAAVDCGGKLLHWGVVAWRKELTGHVVDFGSYPEQATPYFTSATAKKTIRLAHPGGEEASLTAAINQLVGSILTHKFTRVDGSPMQIERLVIDANWQTDTVYGWLEKSPYGAIVIPSHGKFYGASSRALISDYNLQPGESRGPGWLLGRGKNKQRARHLLIDSNHAKSFLARRLQTPTGDRGSLTICADANGHQLLIDHLTSESAMTVKTEHRTAEEWRIKPGRPDNHLLDVLAMCGIAASVQGCSLDGSGVAAQQRGRIVNVPPHLLRRR